MKQNKQPLLTLKEQVIPELLARIPHECDTCRYRGGWEICTCSEGPKWETYETCSNWAYINIERINSLFKELDV